MTDYQREAEISVGIGIAQGRLEQSNELMIEIAETFGRLVPFSDVIRLAKLAEDHGLKLEE